MEILKNIKNSLMKRTEVSVLVEAEKNPGFSEAKKIISKEFSKPEEVIAVYNIKGSFGSRKFKVDAYIYDSKEDLKKYFPKKKSGKDIPTESPVQADNPK